MANILKQHGIDPAPDRQPTTSWSTFIKAHWDAFSGLALTAITLWLTRSLNPATKSDVLAARSSVVSDSAECCDITIVPRSESTKSMIVGAHCSRRLRNLARSVTIRWHNVIQIGRESLAANQPRPDFQRTKLSAQYFDHTARANAFERTKRVFANTRANACERTKKVLLSIADFLRFVRRRKFSRPRPTFFVRTHHRPQNFLRSHA